MIDTIKYVCDIPLETKYSKTDHAPSYYDLVQRSLTPGSGSKSRNLGYGRIYKSTDLGIRVFVNSGIIKSVEAELPKILFGHNGRLITCEKELDQAIQILQDEVRKFADSTYTGSMFPDGVRTDQHFTRIDLVWQFDVATSTIRRYLEHRKHPRINKIRILYGDDILFPGTVMQIFSYCKYSQLKIDPGNQNCTRIEVRFRGKNVCKSTFFPTNPGSASYKSLQAIPFDRLYGIYREELLKFSGPQKTVIAPGRTVEDFLAALSEEHPEIDVLQRYFDFRQLSRKARYNTQKKFNSAKNQLSVFSLVGLLPQNQIPTVVEVLDPSTEGYHRSRVLTIPAPLQSIASGRIP